MTASEIPRRDPVPNPLRVALRDVRENGPTPVKFSAPAELFDGVLREGILTGPVVVDGTVFPVDDLARFEGTAKGTWRFECTRCLKPVDGSWSEALEAEVPLETDALDLAEDARQAVGLAEPMKTLCKPDCKGLCPVCRGDLNAKDCGHEAPAPAPGGEPPPGTRRPRLTRRPKKG